MDSEELEEKMEETEEGELMVLVVPLERKDDVANVDLQDHLDPLLVVKLDPPIH